MPNTESLKRSIIEGTNVVEIKKMARQEGMITLRQCAILNALRGLTSVEEIVRVTMAD